MTALERRTVGSLALLYSFRMLGLFMVLPLLVLYVADFPGATPALVGLALGAYGLTQALLQIPLGWLSDRVGRKPVIVGGLLVFALGSAVAALADSMAMMILGRALQGAGAIAGTIMALVADVTREEQRTKAMALVGISIGLSFALALVVGPAVASAGGLSAAFWFTVVLALAGVVIVLRLVPTPASRGMQHAEVGTRVGLIGPALRDPALARLNFGVFTLHFVLMACFLVVPVFLEQVAGVGREGHWKVYLPVLLLSVVGMVPLMAMAEKGGRPREMFLLAISLTGIGLACMGFVPAVASLYLGLWLFFVGFNYLEATLPSLVSKTVFAGGKGTAHGVYSTWQFMGAFAGGAAGGWVLQLAGLPGLFGLCIGLVGAWALIALPATPVVGDPGQLQDGQP